MRSVVVIVAGLCLAAIAGQPGVAEETPAGAVEGVDAGTEAAAKEPVPPEWCAHRAPMSIVAGYDAGKHFRHVEQMALESTKKMAATLCPGDTVRLTSFGTTVDWIGPTIEIVTLEDREKVAEAFSKRSRPSDMSSVNDSLAKVALQYWAEGGQREGEMPALYVFTDTIRSSAPKKAVVMDFAWDKVPAFLQGRFLLVVSLLDRDAPRGEPKIYVTTAPEGMDAKNFPSGPNVTYEDVMKKFIPEPEPDVAVQRVIEVREQPSAAPWLLWFGTLPGVLSLAGGLLLLMTLFYFVGRGAKRAGRSKDGKDHAKPPREVTLVLWDRLRHEVVREETRTLEGSLRIGPTTEADFVVPGPYSLDLLNGNGEGPSVKSANMLGVEMHRSEGRTLLLAEGEAVPIRTGDRVDIGGGHEIEVKIH